MPRVNGYSPGSGFRELAPSSYTGASSMPESVWTRSFVSVIAVKRSGSRSGSNQLPDPVGHFGEGRGDRHADALEGAHLAFRTSLAAGDDRPRVPHPLPRRGGASRDEGH